VRTQPRQIPALEDVEGLKVSTLEQETMNKHFTQNILNLLLLIVIAFSSGCTQSTTTDSPTSTAVNTNTPQSSQTPAPIIATATITPIPCVSSSQTPTSDIEKEADEWFLSSISQIPSRDQYSAWKEWGNSWETTCGHYQTAILNDEPWVHNPIDIALRTFTFSEYFMPDSVIAVAMPERSITTFQSQTFETYMVHNVVTVVYSILHPTQDLEVRVDLVHEDEIWRIRWIGSRWKCYESNDPKWNIDPCS